MSNDIPFRSGTFIGRGRWTDRKGDHGEYTCEHLFRLEEGTVDQTTKRLFLDDAGGVLYEEHSRIRLTSSGDGFVDVVLESDGNRRIGVGYWFAGCCHYELEVGPTNHLENTYLFDGDGVRLVGSATNNGNPTIWTERSERGSTS